MLNYNSRDEDIDLDKFILKIIGYLLTKKILPDSKCILKFPEVGEDAGVVRHGLVLHDNGL